MKVDLLKVAVLVSGSGSNLQSILDYGQTSFKVEMVIGSKEGIYALERAKNKNIPTYVVSKEEYGSSITNIFYWNNPLTERLCENTAF